MRAVNVHLRSVGRGLLWRLLAVSLPVYRHNNDSDDDCQQGSEEEGDEERQADGETQLVIIIFFAICITWKSNVMRDTTL